MFAVAFTLWGSPVTWLEIAACVLSVWMVLANFRVHPIGWPLAMLSSAAYALLFADSRLYGEASLQLLFITLATWGWWQWLRGRGADGGVLVVRTMTPRLRTTALAGTLVAWPLLGLLLQHATDSDVPFLDALPTVGSITGQVLLGRKYIENWPVWIAVNIVSVALFASKSLWLTVAIYIVFALMAAWGWRAWRKLDGLAHG